MKEKYIHTFKNLRGNKEIVLTILTLDDGTKCLELNNNSIGRGFNDINELKMWLLELKYNIENFDFEKLKTTLK